MTQMKEDPVMELQQAHEYWKELYINGAFDPSWADGVNSNLVRNHMLYYKSKIEEQYSLEQKPAIYYESLPEEVNNDYMAKREEILNRAVSLYGKCSQKKEVNDLLSAEEYMSEKEVDKLKIRIEINRIHGLKNAILKEDYVEMRNLSWNAEERIQEIMQAHEKLINRQHQ
ncbi:hypothetical protein [Anaerorhabdus sp.]|uniref:hypothetical protein n=1 Tax=Anaerorhabdus sp. TaxID=1872524 RepID=UPI002FC733A7